MEQNSDSYSFNRLQAWNNYGALLSGCPNGYILVVSTHELTTESKIALRKSFTALGYGSDSCTYFVATSETMTNDELMAVVEALDPGVLIAADQLSADFLSLTYRRPFPGMTETRIFGRRALAFDSFDALMDSDSGHQKIWAALKMLPRIP